MAETTPLNPQSPQPFETNNLALAIALHASGCQFANENGKTIAGLNKYSLGFIRSQIDPKTGKPRVAKDTPMDEAIRILWRLGIPGNVEYCFLRSETLTAVAKGWDEQGSAKPDQSTPLQASEEEFGRIARALTRSRTDFIGNKEVTPLWRRRDPDGNLFIPAVKHIEGTATTERHGHRSTTTLRDGKIHAVAV